MDNLTQIAALINASTTGCIATVQGDHVSVQVPGHMSLPGGRTARCYSTEKVRTMRAAHRLINSME